MRIGIQANYHGGFRETAEEIRQLEAVGLDIAMVPEVYSFDAVSQLGYLAAVTERVELLSAILPIYSRTPALIGMTAAGLDYVSDGRFILGLGASGPQVIEGWHGVPYDAPLQRTREIVEICRSVWRRDRVDYAGKKYSVPLPADQGTGLGKPLKIINTPVRERVPVMLAALGPKNVELAAEIAEIWEPIWFLPERAADVWGDSLTAGKAKRDAALGELQVITSVPVAIGDDVDHLLGPVRENLALYVGGMGARGKNFYNDLAVRYGFDEAAATVQDLYLDGKKEQAAAALPEEFVRAVSLVGPEGYVAERIAAFAEAGVTTLALRPLDDSPENRLRTVERVKALAP